VLDLEIAISTALLHYADAAHAAIAYSFGLETKNPCRASQSLPPMIVPWRQQQWFWQYRRCSECRCSSALRWQSCINDAATWLAICGMPTSRSNKVSGDTPGPIPTLTASASASTSATLPRRCFHHVNADSFV
jgi:hypothetical protein